VRHLLIVIFSLVLALALFNTLSRLGTVSALFGLLVFALLARANRVGRVSGLERFWLLLAGLVALGLAITFGLAPLLLRYSAIVTDTGRLEALIPLADLPLKTWIAGAGAGGFAEVFKLVQPASLAPSFEYLHNDWVQLVLELGLIGTGLVVAVLVLWWRRVGPSQLDRLRAAAAGGIAAIALHSLGDFNLQIPGTAFAFWVTLGVLCNRAMELESRRLALADGREGARRGSSERQRHHGGQGSMPDLSSNAKWAGS
jgi:O-antigen ligase